MRVSPWALVLLTGIATYTSAADLEGQWKVQRVSGVKFKTIAGAEFEFKVTGNNLTGTARVGHGWPGVAPISKGSTDGDQISFTVDGELPSSDGYPKMIFSGSVHGEEMHLTMKLFYVDESRPYEVEFKGKRILQ